MIYFLVKSGVSEEAMRASPIVLEREHVQSSLIVFVPSHQTCRHVRSMQKSSSSPQRAAGLQNHVIRERYGVSLLESLVLLFQSLRIVVCFLIAVLLMIIFLIVLKVQPFVRRNHLSLQPLLP